jgi:protein-L-isoaspartate(D-aspartate) O-methyltransferase
MDFIKSATLLFVSSCVCTGCASSLSSPSDLEAELGNTPADVSSALSNIKGVEGLRLKNQAVLAALSRVVPEDFVVSDEGAALYAPLVSDLGDYDHYSQPYLLAIMAQEAGVTQGSKVLDIGAGNGYRAAVLSEVGANVFSLRTDSAEYDQLVKDLRARGYSLIEVERGDAKQGMPEHGPYDAILVSSVSPAIPANLLKQLANRGRLIAPIRDHNRAEVLMMVERRDDVFVTRSLGRVRNLPAAIQGIERTPDFWLNSFAEEDAFAQERIGSVPQTALESALPARSNSLGQTMLRRPAADPRSRGSL